MYSRYDGHDKDEPASDSVSDTDSDSDQEFQQDTFKKLLPDASEKALDAALKDKNLELMRVAITGGANINRVVKKKSGSTRLHTAAKESDIDGVNLLLDAGANLEQEDKYGRNALQCALSSPAIIKLLMEMNSKHLIVDNEVLLAQVGKEVTATTMRLFSAATKKRKKYPFTQTVINQEELGEYLSILISAKGPINEIVSIRNKDALHWFCAQIQIDEKAVRVIIFDSLGHESHRWTGYHAALTQKISHSFSDSGKSVSFYIEKECRQSDDYTVPPLPLRMSAI